MTASDPNTPLSKQRARHRTAVQEADALARAARPLAEREGHSGVALVGSRRSHAKPGARPEGINRDADGRQQRRRIPTRYFKSPDAIAEKGVGACSPTEPDRGAPAPPPRAGDTRGANEAARELFATSARERGGSQAGAPQPPVAHASSRTKRRAARPFRRQSTRRHRTDRGTPGCRGPCRKRTGLRWAWRFWGCKNRGAIGDEADAPFEKEEADPFIRCRVERKRRVAFRLARKTASRLTFQEHSAIYGEARHDAGPGVAAGRVDVRGNRGRAGTLADSRGAFFPWLSPSPRHTRRKPTEDSSRRRAIAELIGNN
ncbi:hypothetical protein TCDM_11019 [Trypanosoma cruzi Dm28c]|uniref:Uncharacterized protein n=1 Tax=Trypanosoma cruzi Dm28c TaxID=1416333 RepID=V5D1N7_TRYCR|nr:hypothetical protein TCDM_11019 [Trypanosoma cruzi Dm28c]